MPNSTPRPVQFPVMRKEQFASDEGVSYFNLAMSQIVNAINQNNGQAGAVVLPSGVDVQGSSVTGLGAPTSPTDAVSLGHSNTNYGAPAVGPQLDIGGKNTLKGLAYCYQQLKNLPSIPSATTGSNSNGYWFNVNGIILQFNGNISLGAGDFAVTYPTAFKTFGFPFPVVVYPSGDTGFLSVVQGSDSTTGFTIHQNNVTGMKGNWFAIGM